MDLTPQIQFRSLSSLDVSKSRAKISTAHTMEQKSNYIILWLFLFTKQMANKVCKEKLRETR